MERYFACKCVPYCIETELIFELNDIFTILELSMVPSKRVLVIYPDTYEELALVLQHEMSKLDGFDAAAWTVDHYKQNLPTLSARSNVIFLGNSEENRYSGIYLPQVATIVNISGACFARDGNKVVVFGEGNLKQKEAFEAFYRDMGYGKGGGVNSSDAAAGVGAASGVGAAVGAAFLTSLPMDPLGFGVWNIYSYFKRKKMRNKLRYEQTRLAIYNFLITELDQWLKDGS